MKYLTIDIGGTYTKYAVMNETGFIFEKGKVVTETGSQDLFVKMLLMLCGRYLYQVSGIAISSAGMIDSERGFMYNAGSVFCVKNLNLAGIIEDICHVPVTIENDARCAAMAELQKGSLKNCSNAVVFIIGTAVGGAIICERKVLRGRHLLAGEFSYLFMADPICGNEVKTLAETCGVPALIRSIAKEKRMPEDKLDGQCVFYLAEKKDATVLKCIREYARNIALQIYNCQFVVDPEKIAIGGGISEQKLLLRMIREELEGLNRLYPHEMIIPEVTSCRFHNDANLLGALYVHLEMTNQNQIR